MGIDSNYKIFLQRYKRCWTRIESSGTLKKELVNNGSYVVPSIPGPLGQFLAFPKDVPVCIYDSTGKLKEFNEFKIKTGNDFVFKHILEYPINFLNVNGTEAFFQCFDRGSPINKSGEHMKRYADIVKVDVESENGLSDDTPVLSDDKIIASDSKDWKRYTNDPTFKQEILHYITRKIIFPDEINPKISWTPPPDKIYFLFGGTTESPELKRSSRSSLPKFVPSPHLFFVSNQNNVECEDANPRDEEELHRYLGSVRYQRAQGIYKDCNGSFPESEIKNLLEGEMSAMYFSKVYSKCRKNVMIVTSDGDMLIQCLMACKDRIDSQGNGGFMNKVYLRLLVKGTSVFEDVDINALYEDLCNDPIFVRARISDPAPIVAMSSFLSKNDYFRYYCVGIKNCGKKKSSFGMDVPFVLWAFLRILGTSLGNEIVNISSEGHERNGGNYEKIQVTINESAFITFTKLIYVFKYGESASKKKNKQQKPKAIQKKESEDCFPYPSKDRILKMGDQKESERALKIALGSIPTVRRYLENLKSKDNRMMVNRECRAFARRVEWVLNYFYNGYRVDCRIASPVATFKGLSYHGWINKFQVSNESSGKTAMMCVMADRVSIRRRHIDHFNWFFDDIYKKPLRSTSSDNFIKIYLPVVSDVPEYGEEEMCESDSEEEKSKTKAEMEDEYEDGLKEKSASEDRVVSKKRKRNTQTKTQTEEYLEEFWGYKKEERLALDLERTKVPDLVTNHGGPPWGEYPELGDDGSVATPQNDEFRSDPDKNLNAKDFVKTKKFKKQLLSQESRVISVSGKAYKTVHSPDFLPKKIDRIHLWKEGDDINRENGISRAVKIRRRECMANIFE